MKPDEPVAVYEAPTIQAEVVAGALRAQGIAARVIGSHIEPVAYPTLAQSRVIVRAEDVARARLLIEEIEV